MTWITTTCLLLMVIGGINWGLVGLFDFDLVAFLFGPMTILSRVVYILIGLASIWSIVDYYYTPKIMVED